MDVTPEGGAVSVTATTDGEWVNIGVQDSGIGIPEAEQKDLFVLRNDKSRAGTAGEKGTGLGLHLAHELAKINKAVPRQGASAATPGNGVPAS